ncbi:MAG: hypothetical protein JXQ85_10535 [Cognatishimia sp.]|uniref:hypothetical protein n=1 Tax=Cognatishimia sp. TaxID=2211648 RepID=UPI003B8B23DF
MSEAAQKTLVDALGFQPGVTLRTYGMRRSGNHAIINWLLRNAADGSVFFNNCVVGRPARRTWRSLEVNNKWVNVEEGSPITPLTSVAGDGALVVVSYEDFSPDPEEGFGGITRDLDTENVTHEVLLYRNFMNWAASLLRKLQSNEAYDTLVCLRIMMSSLDKYREMLELVANAKAIGAVPVNYDRWIARPLYRERVLQALGLPLKDNSLGKVQRYGGGSSFQKDAVRAEELNADQRWLEMANDGSFQIILLAASQDEALLALLRQLMPKDADLLANYVEQAQFPYIVQAGES